MTGHPRKHFSEHTPVLKLHITVHVVSSLLLLWQLLTNNPLYMTIHSQIKIYNPPDLWFYCLQFQLPTDNHNLKILNGKFQKKILSFKFHDVLSSVMNSHAVPLHPAQDRNLPLVQCIHTICYPPVGHSVAHSIIRSTAMASQGLCSSTSYFI